MAVLQSFGEMPSHTLYSLSNYTIGVKGVQMEEDPSVDARMQRIEDEYHKLGMRRTVEGILLVHEHRHPHILMLQIGDSFFKLPGDQLKPGEDEVEGLKRAMNLRLGPASTDEEGPQWEVGELLGVWWRPKAENYLYPYVPAHITKPREQRKMFLMQLPERCVFSVPKNMKLLAVPFYDLFESPRRYGNVLSTLPHLSSRINFTYY